MEEAGALRGSAAQGLWEESDAVGCSPGRGGTREQQAARTPTAPSFVLWRSPGVLGWRRFTVRHQPKPLNLA